MEFSLEQLNPTKQELQKIADTYKELKIVDINDKEWFEKVKTARKELQQMRLSITKKAKEIRDWAIKFQKEVIAKENELVAIVEWVEKELKAQEDNYALEVKKEERKSSLPQRIEELKKIGVTEIDEDKILEMDYDQFNKYFNDERARILDEKEAKLKEAQDKIDEAKNKEENERIEKERQEKIEKEKAEAVEKATKETEERLKKEQEEKEKKEAEEKAAAEKKELEDKAKLEKRKKYNKWLEDNGFTEWDSNFALHKQGDRMVLYKKVSEFLI